MVKVNELIVGETNRFAVETVKKICEGKADFANPLTIVGPTGSGKTTLAEAMAEAIAAKEGRRVEFRTAEQFVVEYCRALQKSDIDGFRSKIRESDLLVMDDADDLLSPARKCIRAEFEKCLLERLRNGRLTVLTVRQPIESLPGSEECILRSRIVAGVVCEVEKPNREMCVEILRREGLKCGEEFETQQLEALVDAASGDVWASLGALRKRLCSCDRIEWLYKRAVAVVRRAKRGTTSLVQRELEIPYLQACRLMDMLEARGVVSPMPEFGPRAVLSPESGVAKVEV